MNTEQQQSHLTSDCVGDASKTALAVQDTPGAACRPQGTCPKPWVALVDGKSLYDGRGGVRRFKTEAAALDAAVRKIAAIAKAGSRA